MAAILIAAGWAFWHASEGSMRPSPFHAPLPIALLYGFCWWVENGRNTRRVAWVGTTVAAGLVLGMLLLPTNISVDGRVTDTITGQPVTGAQFFLKPVRMKDGKPKPDGRYSRFTGKYHLYVSWYTEGAPLSIVAPGYLPLATTLQKRPFAQRRLTQDFRLTPVHEMMQSNQPGSGRSTKPASETAVATQPDAIGRARASIKGTSFALQMFRTKTGRFPTTKEGLYALVVRPADLRNEDWGGPYLSEVPVDPWGQLFVYRCPGSANRDFDVVSRGPDNLENTNDDVLSTNDGDPETKAASRESSETITQTMRVGGELTFRDIRRAAWRSARDNPTALP